MPSQTLFLGTALLLAAHAASGQAIYRCGNSYGSKPCAGGSTVEAVAPPSAQDVAQSRRGVEADTRRAEALEKARLAREKAAPQAIVLAPVDSGKPQPEKVADKPRKPEEFKVKGPKPPKKKK